MHLELKCQETRHNSDKSIKDFALEQEDQIQKLRDNYNQQLKILKRDQERLSKESTESKAFEMMDKFFKLTQEKTCAIEDRILEIEMKTKHQQNMIDMQTQLRRASIPDIN